MRKSIYEEALDILDDILVDSFSDPQDEYNDCYMLNFKQIIKIEKAIKKAQKQEKLLELYRELMTVKDEIISFLFNGSYDDYTDEIAIDLEVQIDELEKQIKELENE